MTTSPTSSPTSIFLLYSLKFLRDFESLKILKFHIKWNFEHILLWKRKRFFPYLNLWTYDIIITKKKIENETTVNFGGKRFCRFLISNIYPHGSFGSLSNGLKQNDEPNAQILRPAILLRCFSSFPSSQDHLLQLKLTFTAKASESESNGLTESFKFIFIFIFVRVWPILHLSPMDSLVTSCSSPITASSSPSSLPIFFPRRFLPSRPLLFSLASKSTCFNFFFFFRIIFFSIYHIVLFRWILLAAITSKSKVLKFERNRLSFKRWWFFFIYILLLLFFNFLELGNDSEADPESASKDIKDIPIPRNRNLSLSPLSKVFFLYPFDFREI